uniref:E3 ubiquitin-protein ligase E3D n=1 Tax=Ciona intestinalis TaxID=7719 RepID=F6PJX9_CIOIN|nr:E3 ubiquitin-protein ligase E3D isoform X1 [Ciona intestinalis]|eukprot:XP_002130581.1 E3 ubiquitin-protein ligase E3D isoform X1 [Ciona intestinalis]
MNDGTESEDSSYFMEVYDRIHAVDLVLRGSDHPDSIEISPSKIQTKKGDGTVETYPLVVNIEPTSCTSIQKHMNEGIGMRLQLRDSNPEPQTSLLSTTVKRVSNEISRLERGSSQCGCKTCGLTLFVKNVKFNRVLPLPSQSWRDLFNNWSCCSHSHKQKESNKEKVTTPAFVTNGVLKPRENDCLISDFHIMVHTKTVERKNILLRKLDYLPKEGALTSREMKCSRCRAVLGEAVGYEKSTIEAYKLNKNSIEVLSLRKHLSETFVRPVFFSEFFLERILAQQLSNAVDVHATHMFIVQDLNEKVHVLIRVMNTSTRLYVNNGKSVNEITESTREFCSISTNARIQSSNVKMKKGKSTTENSGVCHHGNGDGHASHSKGRQSRQFTEITEESDQVENDRIRRDGPPCMQGNKVAEVIEKLFSFSTHLISIGRTCNEIREADPTGCERIVKVMYASTDNPKMKQQTAKWLKDERTLTLTYPHEICVQMLLVLVSSTLTMPVAYRVFGDFVVGFLRLD